MRFKPLGACLVATIFATPALSQETVQPPDGQKATYQCNGAFGGKYVYEVDMISEHRTTIAAASSSLSGCSAHRCTRRIMAKAMAKGQMTAGLDAFETLKPLATGLEVVGSVEEKTFGQTPRTWNYTIKIADRTQIRDVVLGDTEIVVIRNLGLSGAFSSDREAHISPTFAEIIYSSYADSSGRKRECHLTALDRSN